MKKIVPVLLSVLMLGGTFAGCAQTSVENTLKGMTDFEAVYTMEDQEEYYDELYDGDSEIYGQLSQSGDRWTAKPYAGKLAYYDFIIAKRDQIKLDRGTYKFYAQMSIDNNTGSTANNNLENDMVLQFRVFDRKTKRELAVKEIYRKDFAEQNEFEEIAVPFAVTDASVTVDCEILTTNTSRIEIKEIGVKGIDASENVHADYKGYFAESVADRELEYDANALYYFDLYEYLNRVDDSVWGYDVSLMTTVLQGIVNRAEPHLFLHFVGPNDVNFNADDQWLEYLTGEGQFLDGKEIVKVERPATLLRLFKTFVKGWVAWDNDVPATQNVACTIAGVEDKLPVRVSAKEGSIYRLATEVYGAEISVDLNDRFVSGKPGSKIWDTPLVSTGSAKNDAYAWAKRKYLDTARVSTEVIAYHVDAYSWDRANKDATPYRTTAYYNLQQMMLSNKDYYIANRCFFFDVMAYDNDDYANDDPYQIDNEINVDYETYRAVMAKMGEIAGHKLFRFGGFNPWYLKYSDQADGSITTDGVAVEWAMANSMGTYFATKDADAYSYTALANASVYAKTPEIAYRQTAKIDKASVAARAAKYIVGGEVSKKNFIVFYMGDYDSGAWLTNTMMRNFTDPNLGKLPLAWPINPTGLKRVPQVANYMYTHATPNDYFVGDHNGYGYSEVNLMNDAQLAEFGRVTRQSWSNFDLDMQLFALNSSRKAYSDKVLKWYGDLSPRGVMGNNIGSAFSTNSEGKEVPWSTATDIYQPVSNARNTIQGAVNPPVNGATFNIFRCILWRPTTVYQLFTHMTTPGDGLYLSGYDFEVVDPYVYFYLKAVANGSLENYEGYLGEGV